LLRTARIDRIPRWLRRRILLRMFRLARRADHQPSGGAKGKLGRRVRGGTLHALHRESLRVAAISRVSAATREEAVTVHCVAQGHIANTSPVGGRVW